MEAVEQVKTPRTPVSEKPLSEDEKEEVERKAKEIAIASIVSEVSGFPTRMIHGSTDLKTIGLDETKIALIHQNIQSRYNVKGTTTAQHCLHLLIGWMRFQQ